MSETKELQCELKHDKLKNNIIKWIFSILLIVGGTISTYAYYISNKIDVIGTKVDVTSGKVDVLIDRNKIKDADSPVITMRDTK